MCEHLWEIIGEVGDELVQEKCLKCNEIKKSCKARHCLECDASVQDGGLPLHACGWFPEFRGF